MSRDPDALRWPSLARGDAVYVVETGKRRSVYEWLIKPGSIACAEYRGWPLAAPIVHITAYSWETDLDTPKEGTYAAVERAKLLTVEEVQLILQEAQLSKEGIDLLLEDAAIHFRIAAQILGYLAHNRLS